MKAFCQRCKKEVDVDAEAPRCPTCLRQSSLLFGKAPSSVDDAVTPTAAPPPKHGARV